MSQHSALGRVQSRHSEKRKQCLLETMDEAERVTHDVHDELAHYGVDHATVEVTPKHSDRETNLNEHAH